MLIKNNDTDIFRHYFGDFKVSRAYPSIFRKDLKPSTTFFISPGGRVFYYDFGTGERIGAIEFVMKLFSIDRKAALLKINSEVKRSSPTSQHIIKKLPTKLNVKVRNFLPEDLAYFSQYNISQIELEHEEVYSVDEYLINGNRIQTKPGVLRFALIARHYENEDMAYVKIYSPNSSPYKWVSNIPLWVPFGLNRLKCKSDTLIITKSVKDKIVLGKVFSDVIGLQSENIGAIRGEDMETLKSMYKHIKIAFDGDAPGRLASSTYADMYGVEEMLMPEHIYTESGIKDYSDYIKRFGFEQFKELVKWL